MGVMPCVFFKEWAVEEKADGEQWKPVAIYQCAKVHPESGKAAHIVAGWFKKLGEEKVRVVAVMPWEARIDVTLMEG